MDFSEHVVISAAGSAAILAGGGDLASAAAFSAFGIFIDLDHFLDYWRETGFNLDIPRFMSYFSERKVKRMVLFMHGWECCALYTLALLFFHAGAAWPFWGSLGWFMHLLLDQRFNYLQGPSYFFIYRLRHNFDASACNRD